MFEKLVSDPAALRRHRTAPFAAERERYLQHCADFGATRATLLVKSTELLFLSSHLAPYASEGVDMAALHQIADTRKSTCKGAMACQRLIDVGRPWLKFLGWWREPVIELQAQT
jgi:anti-sigma factor RsiW